VRRALLCTVAPLAAVLPGSAAAASRVQMMVVGRSRTIVQARSVTLRQTTVRIGHRRCKVPGGTALAGLLATHVPVRVTDVAGCDPASMFVRRIGTETNHGFAGWEYKVGKRDPSTGAADPAGRIEPGQQVLWYWCKRADDCQRTLAVTIVFRSKLKVARVHVRGYDDNGHGRAIAGATVHFGSAAYVTNAFGIADVPLTPGNYRVYATKQGLVPSFPTRVGIAR
jgi:hypothetical protein